jgi:ketosteroid isomerase-like protein
VPDAESLIAAAQSAWLTLAGCAVAVVPRLGADDAVLVSSVVLVLCADGLLNLFPGWFGHFKERVQAAWVRRHGVSPQAGDRHRFGTVNLALGAASLAVAAAAWWHRPLGLAWGVGAGVATCVLTASLVGGCLAEARRGAWKGGR